VSVTVCVIVCVIVCVGWVLGGGVSVTVCVIVCVIVCVVGDGVAVTVVVDVQQLSDPWPTVKVEPIPVPVPSVIFSVIEAPQGKLAVHE